MESVSNSKRIYWSERIRNIEPYVPGEQPKDRKYIKLNTNENPYPPSQKVLEALRSCSIEELKLYPDPTAESLRSVIAQYCKIDKSQVFVGNGSDEVLAFAFMAFFNARSKPVIFPDITYSFYEVYCEFLNINYLRINLEEDFSIPLGKFPLDNGGVVIANPNAPTALYTDKDRIREYLERNKNSVVILDEAYIDFGGESSIDLIKKYPNLLVVQTFSKSRSLAGLRVGFAAGNEGLIEALTVVKDSINSYTLDRLALIGAAEAIKDNEYFEKMRNKIMDTRQRITEELAGMGFKVLPSKSNFVFVSHPVVPAKTLYEELRKEGILVRYFNKPRIDNYLRVSIGTDDEMNAFTDKIRKIAGV